MSELNFKGKEFVYNHHLTVPHRPLLEMKGIHLSGNPDTVYKQAVLQLMTQAFSVEKVPRVGELELVVEDGTSMACDLVLMTEWKTKLPTFFAKVVPRV